MLVQTDTDRFRYAKILNLVEKNRKFIVNGSVCLCINCVYPVECVVKVPMSQTENIP